MDAYRGEEIQPGSDVTSDDAIDAWVRQNVESAYHPSCSCKMGADNDAMAVLNPECQVRHVGALRVVDSSVFPTIPNGNLNAPTIMVAEKIADVILNQTPLNKSQAPTWIAPNWQTTQRLGVAKRPMFP